MVKPYYIKRVESKKKRHQFEDVLQRSYSWKFWEIHRKTAVLESLFNKVAGIKSLSEVFSYEVFF